ncbi:MAG: hypothetical protein ACI4I6_01420 [Hominimerdicola sp.]
MTLYFENKTTIYLNQYEKSVIIAEFDFVSFMAIEKNNYRNRHVVPYFGQF